MQLISILAFVSTFVSIALAQSTPPQCAFSCLTSTNTHGCSLTDNSCLCRNSQFISDQTACITAACTNPSDLQQAEAFAQQNCLQVGVTLSSATPSSTGSGSSASATSPSSSGSSSGSSSTGSSSAQPTSGSSGTSSSSGSAAAPTNSNAASMLSGAAPALLVGIAAVALAL